MARTSYSRGPADAPVEQPEPATRKSTSEHVLVKQRFVHYEISEDSMKTLSFFPPASGVAFGAGITIMIEWIGMTEGRPKMFMLFAGLGFLAFGVWHYIKGACVIRDIRNSAIALQPQRQPGYIRRFLYKVF